MLPLGASRTLLPVPNLLELTQPLGFDPNLGINPDCGIDTSIDIDAVRGIDTLLGIRAKRGMIPFPSRQQNSRHRCRLFVLMSCSHF